MMCHVQPCPNFIPNLQCLYLASQHRLHNSSPNRKRITSALSRHPSSKNKRTVRRHKRKTTSSLSNATDFLGISDDETRSLTAESEVFWLELDENVYEEDDAFPPPVVNPDSPAKKLYRRACAVLQIPPMSAFLKIVSAQKINMKNHMLGEKAVRACCIALANNNTTECLDLEGNNLGVQGTLYVCEILRENNTITELNLSENSLRRGGLAHVVDVIIPNITIKTLGLAGNGFTESDAELLADLLRENVTLHCLDLSHNELRERGGKVVGDALIDNTTLEELDLSWNHLRRTGAMAVANGIQGNLGLKKINLAWNGFHLEGCRALGRALAVNNTLKDLDITCNRITKECLDQLLKGLRMNQNLTHLRMARNPISSPGALSVLEFLAKWTSTSIVYVDILGQDVGSDFVSCLREVQLVRRQLKVVYDVTKSQDLLNMIKEDSVFLRDDPMLVLMEYMRLKNLRLVDLFHSLDNDKSNSLSRKEFKLGLLKSNLPMSERMLDNLIEKLDANKNGEVEFTELIEGQKEHKKKVNRLLHEAVEQNMPFERTEIGRVSDKLRTIMRVKEHFWSNKLARLNRTGSRATMDQVNRPRAPKGGGTIAEESVELHNSLNTTTILNPKLASQTKLLDRRKMTPSTITD